MTFVGPLEDLLMQRYDIMVTALASIRREMDPITAQSTIPGTPGFWVFVGRCWTNLIANELLTAFGDLCILLELGRFGAPGDPPEQLIDLVTGAGGTCRDLAWRIIYHLNRRLRSWAQPLQREELAELSSFHSLLFNAFQYHHELQESLIDYRIAKTLVIVCLSLTQRPSKQLLETLFLPLMRSFTYPHRCIPLADAINHLPKLMVRYLKVDDEMVQSELSRLVARVLPDATMHASVLPRLDTFIKSGNTPSAVPSGAKDDFLFSWSQLTIFIHQRMPVYTLFKQRKLNRLRPCDNLQCASIRGKREMKCCMGCSSAFYCSKECQRADYRLGTHRADCELWRIRHEYETATFAPIDLEFFRALLLHDYTQERESLHLRLLAHMYEYPEQTPFIYFDYQGGRLATYIMPLEFNDTGVDVTAPLERGRELLERLRARAKASNGHIELHFMGVSLPNRDPLWRVMPLRSIGSEPNVYEGLRRIAQGIPSGRNYVSGATGAPDLGQLKNDYGEAVAQVLRGQTQWTY
ncbi:hypothetical protein C8F01DRAFT_550668 [Mycena amicta]|nr:hypothetical protein C8F01DRAFT_550668 [Mycena amicta]